MRALLATTSTAVFRAKARDTRSRTEHMRTNTSNVTRNTKQKDAIRAAFVETGRPLSPEEVLSCAQRNVADLSIATVYRNLKIMVEEKCLTVVQLPGEPSRYEMSGKP